MLLEYRLKIERFHITAGEERPVGFTKQGCRKLGTHRFEKFIAMKTDHFFIIMKCLHIIRVSRTLTYLRRSDTGHIRKFLREICGVLLALVNESVEFLELLAAYCCSDFGHTVILSDHVHKVRDSFVFNHCFGMIADELQSLGKLRVVGDHYGPLSGMNMFVIVE